MKAIFSLLFVLFLTCQSQAQRWFPVGATFTFTQSFWEFPYGVKPAEWTVLDTATIKNKVCHKLTMTKGAVYSSDVNNFLMYVYDSNSVVYWYRKHLDSFTVLYDFNKKVGESWEIFGIKSFMPSTDTVGCTLRARVKEKDTVIINGFTLRRMRIEIDPFSGYVGGYSGGFNGSIVEFVGHLQRPRPDPFYSCHAISESSDFFGLRCFDHPDIGFHDYKLYPSCDYATNSIDEFNALQDLRIAPNPATDLFEITYQNKNKAEATISVCTLLGQQVLRQKLSEGKQKMNVSDWSVGIYFFQIMQEDKVIAKGKLLKQ